MQEHKGRTSRTSLPTLIEDEAFQPLLDPLSEREFDPEALGVVSPTVTHRVGDSGTTEKRTTRKKVKARPSVRRPVTPSEQLESELWAARLGLCGWWQLAALP